MKRAERAERVTDRARMASLEDRAAIMVLTSQMLTCRYTATGDMSDRG
jgi:hypothetical protein